MSEVSFRAFHRVMLLVEVLLSGTCMGILYAGFRSIPGDKKGKLKTGSMVFLVYGGVFFLFTTPEGMGWLHMVFIVVLLGAAAGKLHVERRLALLLSVIFFSVKSLSMMIMRSVDFWLNEYFLRDVRTPEEVFLRAAWNYAFGFASQFLLFVLMLLGVGRQLGKTESTLSVKTLCFLLWPPVAAILFVNVILRLLVVDKEGVAFWLYEEFPVFLGIVPLIAASFYGGILAVIAVCRKMTFMEEERRKAAAREQQARAMKERLKEAGELYDSMRSMGHEMRNHLANLKGIMEYGSREDLRGYLARMGEGMKEYSFPIQTGNLITDVIVNGRAREAAGAGVCFHSVFRFPSSGGYDPYDVGIILSNLLENALEACAEQQGDGRFVSLSGRREKKFFLIQVKNSCKGRPVFGKDGLPLSTKKAVPGSLAAHGIGLSNVRREAEKYLGDMDIRTEDGIFCVAVLLQEREEKWCEAGRSR